MLCFLDDGIGMDPSKFTPESGEKPLRIEFFYLDSLSKLPDNTLGVCM